MALSEATGIDTIEVKENGTLQIRAATKIFRDDVLISQSFHRHCLHPGDDLTNQDTKVVAIANTLWTDDVITAYLASLPQPAQP